MLKFLLSKLLTSNFCLLPSAASQRGMSSIYIIIVITTLAFAIMLAGGSGSLFTGNIGSPALPTPTIDPTAPTAAPTTSTSTGWKITVTLGDCQTGKTAYKLGEAVIEGTTTGDMELSVDDSLVTKIPFSPPSQKYTLVLANDIGFNSKPWKITIKSAGETKATYNGISTGCS